jgi:hypothetical protein
MPAYKDKAKGTWYASFYFENWTGKYERLQGDYGRAREGNERLSDRLQEAKLENKALRGTAADFERVKRAFGLEEVERAVEEAKRREAAEKEQKKAKRKFSRGTR